MPASLLSRRAFRSFELIRSVRITPYQKGMGPTFSLTLYDTHQEEYSAHSLRRVLAYRLTMRDENATTVLYSAADYRPPPFMSIDSDETVRDLLGFLCADYLDDGEYTSEQRDFLDSHAEALECEAMSRFPTDAEREEDARERAKGIAEDHAEQRAMDESRGAND